jgi:hypothetical protein
MIMLRVVLKTVGKDTSWRGCAGVLGPVSWNSSGCCLCFRVFQTGIIRSFIVGLVCH